MFKSAPHKEKLMMVLFCLIGCACFFTAAAPPASAQFKSWVMAKLPDTPEGMAVDSKGNIYTTLFHTGEVVMLKDDGTYDHVAPPSACTPCQLSSFVTARYQLCTF